MAQSLPSSSGSSRGKVVESVSAASACSPLPKWRNWQTRMVQVHVPARVWGFESLLRHQSLSAFLNCRLSLSCFIHRLSASARVRRLRELWIGAASCARPIPESISANSKTNFFIQNFSYADRLSMKCGEQRARLPRSFLSYGPSNPVVGDQSSGELSSLSFNFL